MNDKWKLHYGIHRGTVASRDSDVTIFDTLEEAKQDYRNRKRLHNSIGYYIWYAYVIEPDGKRIQLDGGMPYR